MSNPKRVIVTGATGFVGANLVRRLLRDGHTVHLLVRPSYVSWRIAGIRGYVRLHEVNLGDAMDVIRVVGAIRPEWIFHLAAHGAYSSQTNVHRIVETNVLGTINLVEACLKTDFAAFVNTGSSSEYGFKDHAPSETEWLEPNSHYAFAKASATLYCRFIAQSRNVLISTLRLYSVYGPYEEPTRLMPALIMRGMEGTLPPLVNPDIARDYIHIEDVNSAYLRAATAPGQEAGAVYNVGTGTQTTLREVVDVARRVLAIPVEPVWGSMPDRSWDTNVWVADNHRIRQELDWQPRYGFEAGFRATAEWFQRNPELREHYRADVPKPH